MRQSSNGVNISKENTYTVDTRLEFQAFDMLGPKMRRALAEAPLATLAYPVIKSLAQLGVTPDKATHPLLDARLVVALHDVLRQEMIKTRDEQDAEAGLKPLVRRKRRVR